MSADLEGAAEILAAMRTRVEDLEEPQAVLEAVIPPLLEAFPLYRATVRRIDDVMLEIVALWSAAPTSLGLGARMTAVTSSLPTILRTGKPVLSNETGFTGEFLERIVLTEGIASYVTLPLRRNGQIVGLLSLSSRVPAAFSTPDLEFLEEVAAIVEGRVAERLAR